MKFKKLLILDMDGVLVNSKSNMKTALSLTAKKLKIKLSFKSYQRYLGLPFEKILEKMGIDKKKNLIKKHYEFFSLLNNKKIRISNKHKKDLIKLSPIFHFAVFTSKSRKRTREILKKYKIIEYFVSSDDVNFGKPNPEGIFKIIKKFKVEKENTFFVGDSIYDFKASKAAKIKYFHASWGYQKDYLTSKIKKISRISDVKKFI